LKRLGEILMAKGMVSPDGLRAGLDACRRHGGRLGTWLVRLGLISEGKLLDALAEQSGSRRPRPMSAHWFRRRSPSATSSSRSRATAATSTWR
jgi:hypothetical protein